MTYIISIIKLTLRFIRENHFLETVLGALFKTRPFILITVAIAIKLGVSLYFASLSNPSFPEKWFVTSGDTEDYIEPIENLYKTGLLYTELHNHAILHRMPGFITFLFTTSIFPIGNCFAQRARGNSVHSFRYLLLCLGPYGSKFLHKAQGQNFLNYIFDRFNQHYQLRFRPLHSQRKPQFEPFDFLIIHSPISAYL